MIRKEYSAGAVKLSFWFIEFRKFVELLDKGRSFKDIRQMSLEENLFAAPTPARAKQIYNTVSARIKSLNDSFYPIFLESDLTTQKLFNLTAVMASDTLFFDFVYEVVREKIILGSDELADSDMRIFFKDKQQQNDKVAGWTDITLNRLGRCYKTMLYEAGITNKAKEARKIFKPILDPSFEHWLEDNNMEVIARALTGVR